MLFHKDELQTEVIKNMRGGEGEVTLLHQVKKEQFKNTKIFARLSIPPKAGIGFHEHLTETEYYVILGGKGVVNDDGVEKEVSPGDVMVTGNGAKHSITNTGTSNLDVMAIIITY